MRLEFNEEERRHIAKAEALESEARVLKQAAYDLRTGREKERPLIDRLTFAATALCECGLGMAYDPTGIVRSDKDSPLKMTSQWECSGVLLGTGDTSVTHTAPLPFALYELKSENQPSANGQTTRPDPVIQ